MDDLVAFLMARLDEDEQIARSTMWDGSNNVPNWHLSASATVETGGDTFYAGDRTVANHIDRHDPARVLREVEGKRRIIAREVEETRERWRRRADEHRLAFEDWPPPELLRLLAMPYADHEGYREGWKL